MDMCVTYRNITFVHYRSVTANALNSSFLVYTLCTDEQTVLCIALKLEISG